MADGATRRTAGVVVGLLITWAIALVLGAPAAFAHHPEIEGRSVCVEDSPAIEFRSVSWRTDGAPGSANPLIGIYVNGQRVAEGAYNAGNGYQFSGTIDAAAWADSTVTLTAIAEANWDNDAPPGDQRSVQVAVGPVGCDKAPTTTVEETTTTVCDKTTMTFGPCETTTTVSGDTSTTLEETTTTVCDSSTTTSSECSTTTTAQQPTTTVSEGTSTTLEETTSTGVRPTTTVAEGTSTTIEETTTTTGGQPTTTFEETTSTTVEVTTTVSSPTTTIGPGTTSSTVEVTTTTSTPETGETTTSSAPTTSIASTSTSAAPTTTVITVPAQTLPFTGFEMQTTAFIGLMTLGAGAVILTSTRRRGPLSDSDALGEWSSD